MPASPRSLRIEAPSTAEAFGAVLAAITGAGGDVLGLETIEAGRELTLREIRVSGEADAIAAAVAALPSVRVDDSQEAVIRAHDGGLVSMRNRASVASRDDLAMAYTPGVARVCMAIHADDDVTWSHTVRANSIMVTSDGSDVAGAGDLGPLAALPACEAVSAILKQVAGVDGMPLPIDERDLEKAAGYIAKSVGVFAGVHLTGMTVERAATLAGALRERLQIPVTTDANVAQSEIAGFWRGALDVRASSASQAMLDAGAAASPGSALDESRAASIAAAVSAAARTSGVART